LQAHQFVGRQVKKYRRGMNRPVQHRNGHNLDLGLICSFNQDKRDSYRTEHTAGGKIAKYITGGNWFAGAGPE